MFKVKLDNEIKKLVIHNDDINYNELLLMMQRIFSDKIKPLDEISIKYTDEGMWNVLFFYYKFILDNKRFMML